MNDHKLTFWGITLKAIVVHTVTYSAIGMFAFFVFDYSARFAEPGIAALMRPTNHPLVMAGPLFQPLRGLLFGVVFYLLREPLFTRRRGWLTAWVMLVLVGIFSTFGPAPGSIEGIIYTHFPLHTLPGGMLEVLLQALLLSLLTFHWVRKPGVKWLNWTLCVLFTLALLLPALGLLVTGG